MVCGGFNFEDKFIEKTLRRNLGHGTITLYGMSESNGMIEKDGLKLKLQRCKVVFLSKNQ